MSGESLFVRRLTKRRLPTTGKIPAYERKIITTVRFYYDATGSFTISVQNKNIKIIPGSNPLKNKIRGRIQNLYWEKLEKY